MKVSTILDNVEFGQLALPEFQRGYVWSRDQVRGLMSSPSTADTQSEDCSCGRLRSTRLSSGAPPPPAS